MNFQTLNKQRLYILIAAAAGVISVFLPWITVSAGMFGYSASESQNGFHGWGVLFFIACIAPCIIAFSGNQTKPLDKTMWLAAMVAGGIALLSAIIFFASSQKGTDQSFGFVEVKHGFGIWMALAAPVAIIAAAWLFKNPGDSFKESLNSLKTSISIPVSTPPKVNTEVSSTNKIAELEKLSKLKENGNINEEEYHQLKSKLL